MIPISQFGVNGINTALCAIPSPSNAKTVLVSANTATARLSENVNTAALQLSVSIGKSVGLQGNAPQNLRLEISL